MRLARARRSSSAQHRGGALGPPTHGVVADRVCKARDVSGNRETIILHIHSSKQSYNFHSIHTAPHSQRTWSATVGPDSSALPEAVSRAASETIFKRSRKCTSSAFLSQPMSYCVVAVLPRHHY